MRLANSQIFAGVSFIHVMLTACCALSAEAQLSVADVLVAVSDVTTSIESLDVEYELSFVHSDRTDTIPYRYSRVGKQWRIEEQAGDRSMSWARSIVIWNGERGISYKVDKDESGVESTWRVDIATDYVTKLKFSLDPDLLLGVSVQPFERQSIVDVFESLDSTELVSTSSDGIYELAGEFTKDTPDGSQRGMVTLIVDSSKGFLPVAYRITYPYTEGFTFDHHWRMSEFAQITDASSGEKRWFPMQGELTRGTPIDSDSPKLTQIKVNKVVTNPEFEETLFRPHIADGTMVVDRTQGPTRKFIGCSLFQTRLCGGF